jgi:cell division septation protein DedD
MMAIRGFAGGIGKTGLILGAVLALAGCEDGAKPFGFLQKKEPVEGTDTATAAETPAVSLVERDVEAPEVFNVNDKGLWDGRPSLGGVWVAHSSVTDPERVIIRNPGNGKFVIGALFRRERENPGPSLQVSSDAAAALDMLAGQPADLQVVALRREEVPSGIPPSAAPTDPVLAEAGAIEATKLDPIAQTAAAALDAADGKPAPKPAAAPVAATTEPAPGSALPATTQTSAAAPASGALQRAYVQIGIFSVEANAGRASDQMKKAGMTATVKKDASQGKTFWRVIVGPAASVAEREALASRVKGLGYPDAYPVKN